ncbi:branched-chain amino acid ABC transporter permease [Cognatishimia sp. SS12]|uniref:branched-chain amino acid ABC transporter permease n=1 Tax=Cognatishimia sp. SS12 TaxID=2979465 RepID=UPI0023303403|nr:branched-chain amino acid ABC transporter permease [Cognatishimia sp. SS12]MDC0739568.1 branched-chain amino acid ABC transporter permease [Cognatishimia sp. SS12]
MGRIFSYATLTGLGLLILALIALPLMLGALWIKVLTSAAIFALAAAGVALVYAQLGLINLAQIALIGVGGWIALRLNYATDLPVTLLVLIAGTLTGVIGAIFALPALRMRGLYLALVTLMVAALFQIFFNAFQFPNGGEGFWGVAQKSASEVRRPGFAESDVGYYRYTLIFMAIGFGVIGLHKITAPGRAWAMIRQSEANAMATGVNVTLYKLWAFALSGLLAGTAGALLAGALGQLDARSFLAGEGILLFALAVVGGVFSWVGAIVAGLLYKLLPALFNDLGLSADVAMIIFGAALMHAIMTAPQGIAGQILGAFNRGGSDD